jgi:hypothetical protein
MNSWFDLIGEEPPLSRLDWILISLYVVAVLSVYILLHGIYRPENMDDAVFLSFAYNHVVRGIEDDLCFGASAGSGGYGGVIFFGKTFTYFYGSLLNFLGWTKGHAYLISTFMVFLSDLTWVAILNQLGFSRRLTVFFGLVLLITEPFFSAANQARPDALVFFLATLALLCFVRGWFVPAGFLASVSMEIHPVGIISFLWVASVAMALPLSPPQSRRISGGPMGLRLAMGLVLGVLYYLSLHHRNLVALSGAISGGNAGGVFSILIEYFFKTKHLRHLPELALFLACALWFLGKRLYRKNRFIPAFLLAVLAFSIIIRRPSFMYMIYIYPALLLLVLWTFEGGRHLRTMVILWLVYLLPQYGFVYVQNHDWNLSKYLANVQQAVPSDMKPVVGRYNDWFAFVNRSFYGFDYGGDFRNLGLREFYMIEDEAYRLGKYPQMQAAIGSLYTSKEVSRFTGRGEMVVIKKFTIKKIYGGDLFRHPQTPLLEKRQGFNR